MPKKEKKPERHDKVTYWLNEISASRKREKDFRKEGQRILDIYGGEKSATTPFNILYSNTETLMPAIYSSVPRPIVQRRFKDDDPIGKLAAEAGQRLLEFLLDTNVEGYETFDQGMKNSTLDALLPGRAVTCVKYDAEEGEMPPPEGSPDAPPTPYKDSELVCVDSRSWNRVFFGYAKKWSKVPWIAYEEHIDKQEAVRLFGEDIAAKIVFTTSESDEDDKKDDEDKGERKTALVYQIWDKEGGKKVRYISAQYADGFLKVDDDELQLTGFFNCPKPLSFLEKSNDLLPVALYCLYENQAKELNELTRRISRIVKAIKARGVYDSELGDDIKKLFEADDNEMVPADKASSLAAEKGLQNAIWFAPIEVLMAVLEKLYLAREKCKQVIYEITGIADIMRGASIASETLGAQKIKESWGTLRLKRLQKEVQRYARDLLRMMLEIAATKFSEETWAKMTGLPFVTTEQRQQLEQIAKAAQMSGQPLDEQTQAKLQAPVWGKVLEVLRDDTQRAYRIDIETNSTVEPEAVEDQKQISDVMTALGQYLNAIGPLVQKGVMPFQAAQSMMLAIVRRYRFGSEIEDYIKQMKPPQPEGDGGKADMAKLQAEHQQETQRLQQEQQAHAAEQQRLQREAVAKHQREIQEERNSQNVENMKLQTQKEIELAKIEGARQARLMELQSERQTAQMKARMEQDTELKKVALQSATQIEIAEITATKDAQKATSDNQAAGEQVAQTSQMMEKILERQDKLLQTIAAPRRRKAIHDGKGRISETIETIDAAA